jgi:hypothetical protein
MDVLTDVDRVRGILRWFCVGVIYTWSFSSVHFTVAVFTHAGFQKSPEIFASCGFDVIIPLLMSFAM